MMKATKPMLKIIITVTTTNNDDKVSNDADDENDDSSNDIDSINAPRQLLFWIDNK